MSMSHYNFFSEGSPFLQHPLLTAERTAAEIAFLVRRMELASGARILDVGCGFGRHTIELARRGFAVTGIDASPAMIAAAREKAAAAGVTADLRRVRAEAFETEIPFEAAICLFTTLGQITAAVQSELKLLTSVRSALAQGSPFAVEVPQREAAVRQLKSTERFGRGQYHTKVSRRFDPAKNVVSERFDVISPQKKQTFDLEYRLYNHDELLALLNQAGFAPRESSGNYSDKPLQKNDAIMLVIAEAI